MAKAVPKAFTLVEVALALGIVSFALIAIFSLIGVSLRNSHEANVRQGLTLAIDQVNSMYQGQSFATATAMLQTPTNVYFDNTGGLIPSADGAYFRCSIANVTPAASPTANYLSLLQLKVTWPNSQAAFTNVSVFSILNSQ